jgi:L-alanine-DL-glutamate epimerase-like enolase superfamily enzyme
LILYGGLRPEIDYLLFDCVHSYGLVEYLRIISMLEEHRWSRRRCYPHGGHLFSLHMTLGLRLGGTESHVGTFQPFGGLADDTVVERGYVKPPETPGIGFETKQALWDLLQSLGKG